MAYLYEGAAVYAAGKAATAGHGGAVAGAFGNSPAPKVGPPPPMPDQTTAQQAGQLQAAKNASLQYGRAATVLTQNQNTGDLLGP